jgi:hypothetical protein
MMQTEIQLSQITELLPKYVSLYFVDYREDLSGHIDRLQECISGNCWDSLYEELDYYLCESRQEGLSSYKNELKNDIMVKFNADEDQAYELVCETYGNEIEDFLAQKDSSDAVSDLLKNTSKFSFFMDTELEIEDGSWSWTRSEQTGWLKKIKRKLKIDSNRWDEEIRQMLSEASFGGQLVVYFYDSVENLLTDDNEKEWKSVLFTNPVIAIIHTGCGSGFDTCLQGHKFMATFNRKSLFIDKYFKYNYVSAVCGMSQDWCKYTVVKFSFESIKGRKITPSPLAAEALQDRKYASIFS